jgi:hypothetical protein
VTESTHTYTAVLIGAPDVPLSVRGGRITLDSGSAPHVRGFLDVAWPDEATLTTLDPRLNARIRVVANATFPTFSQSRTFNLGLRSRPTRHRDAVVSLDLASDEALLSDYRAKSDDRTPRTLETSLRSIVNYVLGKIGASLAATPANDADMTAYWSLSNLLDNPQFEAGSIDGWALQSNASGLTSQTGVKLRGTHAAAFNAVAAGSSLIRTDYISASAGDVFTGSVYARATAANQARVLIDFFDENNGYITGFAGAYVTLSTTGWERLSSVGRVAPAGAAKARLLVQYNASAAGQTCYVDAAMLTPGDELVDYFDGSTAPSAFYTVAWSGTAHSSTSTRTPLSPLDARDPDSLVWRAGDSGMEFLHPLVQAAGYRLVCDEARVWTLRSGSYVAAGNLTLAAGVNLTDATDTLSRDSDDWFDAQVTRYVWDDANGITRTKVDYWGLTSSPTKVRLVEVNAPYPGTGRSQYAVKRAQGRGRVVQASQVADWTARAEQAVTVLLNGAPTQTGLTESVAFDLDLDEVSITTRTTDTLPGSIDLLPGTIDALTGVINDL